MKFNQFREEKDRRIMRKSKGKWIVCSLLLTTGLALGNWGLNNETVLADFNTVATNTFRSLNASSFADKATLEEDRAILSASQEAVANIEATWSKNTEEEVRAEIARQKEAGLDAYVVQWGDTLSVIAAATGQSVDDLAEANQLGNIHLILTGDLLTGVLGPRSANSVNHGQEQEKQEVAQTSVSRSEDEQTSVSEQASQLESKDQTEADTEDTQADEAVEENQASEAAAEEVQITVLVPENETVTEATNEDVSPEAKVADNETTEPGEDELNGVIYDDPATIDPALPGKNAEQADAQDDNQEQVESDETIVEEMPDQQETIDQDDSTSEVVEEAGSEVTKAEIDSDQNDQAINEETSQAGQDSVDAPENASETEANSKESSQENNNQTTVEEPNAESEETVETAEGIEEEAGQSEATVEESLEETGDQTPAEDPNVVNEEVAEELSEEATAPSEEKIEEPLEETGNQAPVEEPSLGNEEAVEIEEDIKEETDQDVDQSGQVTSQTSRRVEVLHPQTKYVQDDQLEEGQEKVVQAGERVIEVTIDLVDGQEVSRQEREVSVTPAQDKIIHRGTRSVEEKTQIVTEKVTIPFQTRYQDDEQFKDGTEKIIQEGQNGEKEISYEITYRDGKEVSRKKVDERVTKETIDKIVRRGTQKVADNQHVVVHGESLWSIAQKYGVTVEGIRQASGLDSNVLYTNQVLTIPKAEVGTMVTSVLYGAGRGDTVNSVANKFGVSAASIRQANGLSGNWLAEGQTLQIPNATAKPMNNTQSRDGKQVVMLDPGHGDGSGAQYAGVNEGTLNRQLAQQLTQELQSRGYTVISARPDATDVSLLNRSRQANVSNADIFISLHHNSMGAANRGTATGIETFYYEYYNGVYPAINGAYHNDGQRLINSAYLAQQIQGNLIGQTGAINRGVKTNTFSVLRETDIPAVLVEYGFGDNPSELRLLKSSAYQAKLVQGTADAVDTYFSNVH
ncbi:N-acetylmuramoyl-L-alanine amidase [Aerococcus kribbianus]|uniref:N-acetylmuramoyl-L-alanine amidase n=1 Tax=Aerococcus kribbianus TaxID=2999064 RepID=A0A9X3JFS3_9LACT|nr:MULTISPECIES: N-acetylmuramoyl-L-alanine amidase [unclassified Aerococcus]MCZ0717964.1 N-acetylmuramoyl-L-alanine amidase [Aerococcus sp. YH-aer221]MCZ0726251.1 N-acetylmuramoyl-L-alanine amidase [Aerococcus sp. YH-aer222]